MKKFLFVIARYNDHRMVDFDTKISPRNKEYCNAHGFKYIEVRNDSHLPIFRGNPTWWKFTILNEAIDSGKVQDGDIVTHLDADMYIVKMNKPYVSGKSFSYSIDCGNTHCMGNYSVTINEWSRKLIKNILSEERYRKLNNVDTLEPTSNTISSFWQNFREQASWYSLAGIQRHSWTPFFELPNLGFHSHQTEDTVYSLQELQQHVEPLPSTWNTTHDYDSQDRFNINKVQEKDVIIRHFAGHQPWNVDKWKQLS